MGEMQEVFEALLSDAGYVSHGSLRFPALSDVSVSKYSPDIRRVYMQLGGVLPTFPLNLRSWDMEFEGVAVELDEYLHFNQYRRLTLSSPLYELLPSFPLAPYRKYCDIHEPDCLKAGAYGGKWSNTSCESQFGVASAPKSLAGNGSPRWKQRAFYDFVKDLSPLLVGVKVVRIAVWDTIAEEGRVRTVKDALSAPCKVTASALAHLIRGRAPSDDTVGVEP